MRNISPSVAGSCGVVEGACGGSGLDDIEAVATSTIGAIQANDGHLIGLIS
jgi:hypothetical protein